SRWSASASAASSTSLGRRDELVAHAPHRLDPGVGAGELVAELLHVDVHRARLARVGEAPHFLEEAIAREDDAGLTAERLEELELLGAEAHGPIAHVHLVTRRVDPHVADPEGASAPGHPGRAPQDRADARDKLFGIERLREVVVHARLELLDLLHV